jgi:hypothetical protein
MNTMFSNESNSEALYYTTEGQISQGAGLSVVARRRIAILWVYTT